MTPVADPYLYSGTMVLINKFDVRDQKKLDEIEAAYVSLRLSEIAEKPLPGKYDNRHLRAIHKYIFGDLYEWAGEYRSIDIEKEEVVLGGLSIEYSPHEKISGRFTEIMKEMKAVQWLKFSQKDQAQKFKGEIKMAYDILTDISQDADERARFRARRKFQMDMTHNLIVAVEENRKEIARNLLTSGVSLEIIVKSTGLPLNEIQNLAH
jgi:hypothetical protein